MTRAMRRASALKPTAIEYSSRVTLHPGISLVGRSRHFRLKCWNIFAYCSVPGGPMQGRAFLEVAREVVADKTEAHWRATVIHAYYALFLECRDALSRWGIAIPPRQNAHTVVRLRFLYAAHADLKAISWKLDNWCRFRNRANYDLSTLWRFARDTFARDAIREVTAALALLD